MENQLPAEIQEASKGVSEAKRNEVQSVLKSVFDGVSKIKEQLSKIEIADENDLLNMSLANTVRLAVRQKRLDAAKIFDAKRAEVQAMMLGFQTEDKLWLKAKQVMEILTKEIEEQARYKHETKIRFDAQQKELKIQERILSVQKFNDQILRTEFENLSDDAFTIFLSGIEKTHNDKLEAERLENEAREKVIEAQKIHLSRKEQLLNYWQYVDLGYVGNDFSLFKIDEWNNYLKSLKEKKQADDERQKAQQEENERLKKEAEQRNKELEEQKANAAAEQKLKDDQLALERKEAQEKIDAEQAENKRLQDELNEKKLAEEKRLADIEAENEAKLGHSDKQKMLDVLLQLELLKGRHTFKSKKYNKLSIIVNDLIDKVIAFTNPKI